MQVIRFQIVKSYQDLNIFISISLKINDRIRRCISIIMQRLTKQMITCASIHHFNVLRNFYLKVVPVMLSASVLIQKKYCQSHFHSNWQSSYSPGPKVVLTFCGIWARAEAMRLAFSSVRFLTIDPRENTTIPSSPELWTNSSISYNDKILFITNMQDQSGGWGKFTYSSKQQSQEKCQKCQTGSVFCHREPSSIFKRKYVSGKLWLKYIISDHK